MDNLEIFKTIAFIDFAQIGITDYSKQKYNYINLLQGFYHVKEDKSTNYPKERETIKY